MKERNKDGNGSISTERHIGASVVVKVFFEAPSKKYRNLFSIVLMLGLILFPAADGYSGEILVHRDSLLAKAAEEGNVRVIVTFKVSSLEKQQETSRQSTVLSPGLKGSPSGITRAREADAALAGTIRSSASDIFAGLGLENKVAYIFKTVPQAVIRADYSDLLALEGRPQVLRVTEDKPVPLRAHARGGYGEP